jgi:alkylation response protein AidB-like acyl-CoA dehydrogenase
MDADLATRSALCQCVEVMREAADGLCLSPKVEALRELLRTFTDRHVVPRLGDWPREVEDGAWPPSMIEPLREQARAEGLWHEVLPSPPRGHSRPCSHGP